MLSDVRLPLLGAVLVTSHFCAKGLLEIAGQLRTESRTVELIGLATLLMVQAESMMVGCGVLRSGSKDGYRPSSAKLLLNMRGRFQEVTTAVEAATYGTINVSRDNQMEPRGFQRSSMGMATLQTGPKIGTEAPASTASHVFAVCLVCSVGCMVCRLAVTGSGSVTRAAGYLPGGLRLSRGLASKLLPPTLSNVVIAAMPEISLLREGSDGTMGPRLKFPQHVDAEPPSSGQSRPQSNRCGSHGQRSDILEPIYELRQDSWNGVRTHGDRVHRDVRPPRRGVMAVGLSRRNDPGQHSDKGRHFGFRVR